MLILWRKNHSCRCWSIFAPIRTAYALLIPWSWIRILWSLSKAYFWCDHRGFLVQNSTFIRGSMLHSGQKRSDWKPIYIPAIRTRFVQPGKIEIDANERAAIGKRNAAFSFAPSSILSLTICWCFFWHQKRALNQGSQYFSHYFAFSPFLRLMHQCW